MLRRRSILLALAPISVAATLLFALGPASATTTSHHQTTSSVGCRPAPAHITVVSVWRTKNSAGRVERITVQALSQACRQAARNTARPLASQAPAQTFSCLTHATITWKSTKNVLNSRVWTDTCTGASACSQAASMYDKDVTTNGSWALLKDGSQTSGCTSANYAWVNVTCYTDPDTFSYHGHGIYTIVWDDGQIGHYSQNSPNYTFRKACG
jgi:hypothetical protein